MKSNTVRTCKWCPAKIRGGECCSNCASKNILVRDIQTMVRNKVNEIERKKKNRERQSTLNW